jgi:hypothetical protein
MADSASSSSSSSVVPVLCGGAKLTMLSRALRGDVDTLHTVILHAVDRGRPMWSTFMWRDDEKNLVELDHIIEIQLFGRWLIDQPFISVGDLHRIYKVIGSMHRLFVASFHRC